MARRNEKLYHVYHGIKQRCYNTKNPKYSIYGGKGVIMCKEWYDDYDNFKTWSISHGYKPNSGMSIDRINSDGNYEPSNCRWIPIGINSARANYGRKKFNGHRSGKVIGYNINTNEKIEITNITKFAKDIGMNPSLLCHKVNGRVQNPYWNNWKFYREI